MPALPVPGVMVGSLTVEHVLQHLFGGVHDPQELGSGGLWWASEARSTLGYGSPRPPQDAAGRIHRLNCCAVGPSSNYVVRV